MPRWGVMWTIAVAIFAAGKGLSYRDARLRGVAADRGRTVAYFLAWPGMDAAAFLSAAHPVRRPAASEWTAAALKTIFGVALTFVAARPILRADPVAAGWIAMAGIAFVLHFGAFHLASVFWRSRGVNAEPVMRNPLRSTSLAEFWGRRWN